MEQEMQERYYSCIVEYALMITQGILRRQVSFDLRHLRRYVVCVDQFLVAVVMVIVLVFWDLWEDLLVCIQKYYALFPKPSKMPVHVVFPYVVLCCGQLCLAFQVKNQL